MNHQELAGARNRGDFQLLWMISLPMVRLIVGRMLDQGLVRKEDVDEDLLQEGALIVGHAVRTWDPIRGALSTHIGNQVRGGLLDYLNERPNAGIGGKDQSPVVLSLETPIRDSTDADDDVPDTLGDALTYAGAALGYGQYDGEGDPPAGLGDPADEAEREQTQAHVRAALAFISDADDLDILSCVYGIDRPEESVVVYARRKGIHHDTAYARLARAEDIFRRNLPKSLY